MTRIFLLLLLPAIASAQPLVQEPNTWVKRSPLPDGPRNPMLGYEASFGYDPVAKKIIRWAGHTQSGGHEQLNEVWTYDPRTAKFELIQTNTAPPGVCCAQQDVFDPVGGNFLRFKGFSGSHGWQWFRENYLTNSSVWSFNLWSKTWTNMKPMPEPLCTSLRCASWDKEYQVAVVFGGENNSEGTLVYDPYDNEWTRMHPKVQPAFRSGGNMAYDVKRKRHILFGAQFTDDPHTWAYDLKKNEWTDLKPKVQPPTKANDAVLVYDEEHDVIVASVKSADSGDANGSYETWVYLGDENTWKKMETKESPPGFGNRRRIMSYIPDLGVTVMENYVNPPQKIPGVEREQQMWTYRYAAPKREGKKLYPPHCIVSSQSLLAFTVADAVSYEIYEGDGDRSWQIEYRLADKRTTADVIKDLKVGGYKSADFVHFDLNLNQRKNPIGNRFYYVVAKDAQGRSSESNKIPLRRRSRVEIDVSVISPTLAKVRCCSISAFHVERAVVEVFSEDELQRLRKDTSPLKEPSVGGIRAIGEFKRITEKPVDDLYFNDTTVDLTKPAEIEGKPIFTHRFSKEQINAEGKKYRFAVYAYRVRAVNAGVEGGPSPYVLTIPSAPQHLLSKEVGDDAHLKWAKNPEEGIKGYRVYRMESPRINGPGQKVTRVTAKPITETTFIDKGIGKEPRRYWVVPVDAIGQEGVPSAPTWHYRFFKSYYDQFAGEWHQ